VAKSYHQPRTLEDYSDLVVGSKTGLLRMKIVKNDGTLSNWFNCFARLKEGVLSVENREDGSDEEYDSINLKDISNVKTARSLGSTTIICLQSRKNCFFYIDAGCPLEMKEWLLAFHKAFVYVLVEKFKVDTPNRHLLSGRSQSGDVDNNETGWDVYGHPNIYSRSSSPLSGKYNPRRESAFLNRKQNSFDSNDSESNVLGAFELDNDEYDNADLSRMGTRDFSQSLHLSPTFISPRSEGNGKYSKSFSDDSSDDCEMPGTESTKRSKDPFETELCSSIKPAAKYVPPHMREGYVADDCFYEEEEHSKPTGGIFHMDSSRSLTGGRPSLRERFGSMSVVEDLDKKFCVYGRSARQGARRTMEDFDTTQPRLGDQPLGFYAVYDGHCGIRVAELASKKLHSYCTAFDNGSIFSEWPTNAEAALLHGFECVEEEFKQMANQHRTEDYADGSCALVALVHHSSQDAAADSLMIANLGDSRAVLHHNSKVEVLTTEHSPILEKERQRIEAMDGWVTVENEMGLERFNRIDRNDIFAFERALEEVEYKHIGRVNGELAVSRALGDLDYKDPFHNDYAWHFPQGHGHATDVHFKFKGNLVDPTPDISLVHLEPLEDSGSKSFLIIACDGLWDVMTSEEAVEICLECNSAQMASENLVEAALALATSDNVTVLVISLKSNKESIF